MDRVSRERSFLVSAPGKVILFGEYAVVYGKTAMAAPISLRSYLLTTHTSHLKPIISLVSSEIQLSHSWNVESLPWPAFSAYHEPVTSLDPCLVEALEPFVRLVSPDLPKEQRQIHQNCALAFLYLFISLGSPQLAPCTYSLRSTIPTGAGLGSSASISVCIACALLLQIGAIDVPGANNEHRHFNRDIELINHWAYVAELCIHGRASGIDNTVSSTGKAILFQCQADKGKPFVQELAYIPKLPLLIVDTMQSRSTKEKGAQFATLMENHPVVARSILDAIDAITRSALRRVAAEDFDPNASTCLQYLGELTAMNHRLLSAIGASHSKIERVCNLIDHSGVGWTKLTGAGGGGCTISLLRPSELALTSRLVEVEKKLVEEGFRTIRASLSRNGVGVVWPAETDQEEFLTADGAEGVEKLVGLGILDDDTPRQPWRFWLSGTDEHERIF